jgi:hypothetical protein
MSCILIELESVQGFPHQSPCKKAIRQKQQLLTSIYSLRKEAGDSAAKTVIS